MTAVFYFTNFNFVTTGNFNSSFLILPLRDVPENKPHHYPILAGITTT